MVFLFYIALFYECQARRKKAQRKKEIVCMVGFNRANLIMDAYFFLHHALKNGARFSKK